MCLFSYRSLWLGRESMHQAIIAGDLAYLSTPVVDHLIRWRSWIRRPCLPRLLRSRVSAPDLRGGGCRGMAEAFGDNGREAAPDRKGFYLFKTAFKPYDLAVQCALLICKRHLREGIAIHSGGSDFHWNDPRRFCLSISDTHSTNSKNDSRD
jgi:hypothetical protein